MSEIISILIAEDSNLTQKVLLFMLKKHGFDVIAQCEDGRTAIDTYKKLKPDIVLMDIAMPEIDGITAIKEIRKIDPMAKIISVSALYSPKMRERAMKAGALDYIIKPFEVSELISSIEEVYAREIEGEKHE